MRSPKATHEKHIPLTFKVAIHLNYFVAKCQGVCFCRNIFFATKNYNIPIVIQVYSIVILAHKFVFVNKNRRKSINLCMFVEFSELVSLTRPTPCCYIIDDFEIENVFDLNSAKQFLKDNCYFQYVVEPDMRRRGQLEGLFNFLLNVRYVDKEH